MSSDDLKLYELYLTKIKECDEISFKMLGLVPLLSVASVFTLLTQTSITINQVETKIPMMVFCITGLFGAMITWFIYRWELRNIQTCKAFRDAARKIEERGKDLLGIYTNFPSPPLLGKTAAEGGIYYLTIIFWLFLPIFKMVLM